MYCSSCGKEIGSNCSFCPHCGASRSDSDAKQTSPKQNTQMGEIHITAEKRPGALIQSSYYVYVGDIEYKCSPSANKDLVIKVTPETHIVMASLTRVKDSDRLSALGNIAGDVSSASAIRAHKSNSAGAGMASIVGFSVWAASKLTTAYNDKLAAIMCVDLSTQSSVRLKLKSNFLNKVTIEEE